ncbi:MAG: glycosyltransferase [Chloroflexi bacterium]|nr:glycosyltransferase [Chloroflexota bacterium]
MAPALASPLMWGGAARMHGLMQRLARRYEVALLALLSPDQTQWIDVQLAATSAYGRRVHVVVRACDACAPGAAGSTRPHDARGRVDVIQVEFAMIAYYRFPPGATVVLDEHNIEYELRRRMYESGERGLRGVHNYLEYVKLRREEQAAWRRAAGVVVTSERDATFVRGAAPAARVAVVPNAVDTEQSAPGGGGELGEPGLIAFSGSNHYYPNQEALQYFLREVFPLVRCARPDARLAVVGYSPPELVRALESTAMRFAGAVPDLRPELRRARAIIAPLRSGGRDAAEGARGDGAGQGGGLDDGGGGGPGGGTGTRPATRRHGGALPRAAGAGARERRAPGAAGRGGARAGVRALRLERGGGATRRVLRRAGGTLTPRPPLPCGARGA